MSMALCRLPKKVSMSILDIIDENPGIKFSFKAEHGDGIFHYIKLRASAENQHGDTIVIDKIFPFYNTLDDNINNGIFIQCIGHMAEAIKTCIEVEA